MASAPGHWVVIWRKLYSSYVCLVYHMTHCVSWLRHTGSIIIFSLLLLFHINPSHLLFCIEIYTVWCIIIYNKVISQLTLLSLEYTRILESVLNRICAHPKLDLELDNCSITWNNENLSWPYVRSRTPVTLMISLVLQLSSSHKSNFKVLHKLRKAWGLSSFGYTSTANLKPTGLVLPQL